MGVITISLDNETEQKLRKLAREKYGDKKGAMSMVIKNSLELVEENRSTEEQEAREWLREIAHKGIAKGMVNLT